MKERWVIRYDGYIDDEIETTWIGYDDLHTAADKVRQLTLDGWFNVSMEWNECAYGVKQ